MTQQPNTKTLERNHVITVQLLATGKEAATVFVEAPSKKVTQELVDLRPLFAGGMSERDALEWVRGVVAIGIKGADLGMP